MPKFIVIDQSLRHVGGHHFDYAFHVLSAASELGFETVLACNRRFCEFSLLPPDCRALPVFQHHTYSRYSDFVGIRYIVDDTKRGSVATRILDWYKSRRHQRGRQSRITSFAQGCEQLLDQIDVARGDHVLATTVSDLDLLGLATFLRNAARPLDVDWHLQFHFNIFDGREPDYDCQSERLERIRSRFREALGSAQGHRLHFYNTSEPLATQYNCLDVASFEPLAYPVNPVFRSTSDPLRQDDRPLRVTCAGNVRKEKGLARLTGLVADLWDDCLTTGAAQLVVQARMDQRSGQPEAPIPLPSQPESDGTGSRHPPIDYVPHPLAMDDYVDLVRSADIGLMIYDSDRYYARRAGVLGEYLTAGVPVIVPAGCWLAEQIAEPNFRYLDSLAARCDPVLEGGVTLADWDTHSDAGATERGNCVQFGAAADRLASQIEIPAGATDLLLTFRWHAFTSPGVYTQLHSAQLDAAGNELTRAVTIVGARAAGNTSALVHLNPQAATIRCEWSNAYHDSVVVLEDVYFRLLAEQDCPLGAVGLVAADADQVGRLLRDVIQYHAHYRTTAHQFASDWFHRHDPKATVEQLIRRCLPRQRKSVA